MVGRGPVPALGQRGWAEQRVVRVLVICMSVLSGYCLVNLVLIDGLRHRSFRYPAARKQRRVVTGLAVDEEAVLTKEPPVLVSVAIGLLPQLERA